jgi:hypothetical protein
MLVHRLYRVSQEKRSIFWEAIVSVILTRNKCVYVSYSEQFSKTAISLYSFKTVDKKDILRSVSNSGIYCFQVLKLVQFT